MKIKYSLYSPSKNYTALVLGKYSEEEKKTISKQIFNAEPACEQAGFVHIENNITYLDMAGGEFCGNASMCAALMTEISSVKCSGNDEILSVDLNGSECVLKCKELPAGIKHHVFEGKPNKEEAEAKIKTEKEPSGYMFLDGDSLIPLVYIPEIDTLFWENACASGSLAVGDYLYKQKGSKIEQLLKQPGGEITVTVDENGYQLREIIEFVKDGYVEY